MFHDALDVRLGGGDALEFSTESDHINGDGFAKEILDFLAPDVCL